MAEGYANSLYNWPNMNWAAADLSKEQEGFYQHCEFYLRRASQQMHREGENAT